MKIIFKLILCFALVSSYTSISLAEIVVVVHPGNPLTSLELSNIKRLFLGKTTKFSNGEKAVPFENSSQKTIFHHQITGKEVAQLKAYWARRVFSGKGFPPKEIQDSGRVKTLIANDPTSIGYIDSAAVDPTVKVIMVLP